MTARLHHYLPQCYLKRFTKGVSKKSKLQVFDIEDLRTFETIPRNVGGVRDFNRVDVEGESPDGLEERLSRFESVLGPALERLDASSEFSGDDRDVILELMAMMAIRTPHMRENMRKAQAELMDRMLEVSLATQERWESQVRQMRDAGYGDNEGVSYEDMKEFHASKNYRIDIAREHHIAMEFSGVEAILPSLHARNWLLIKAPEGSPFITCDCPMMLTWIDSTDIPPIQRDSPGYAMGNTQVYCPLTRRHALVGEFDGHGGSIEANAELVSCCNAKALLFASKQIYAPSTAFQVRGFDGEFVNGNRLLSYIEERRRK